MKKYMIPSTEVVTVMTESMILSGSVGGYNVNSNISVGMGGDSDTQIPQ